MIRIAAAVAAILFFAAWAAPAEADFNLEVQRCNSGSDHPDIRIISCTRNINSGRFVGSNLAIAFYNRAVAYRETGQWDKAIADYTEAISLDPDDADIFNSRGNAYYGDGQFDQAIDDYDQAIDLDPSLPEAFSNRGNVYRKAGKFDLAIEDYGRAMDLRPGDGQIVANRGLAYEKMGDREQAVQDFKTAFNLGFFHPLLLKKLNQYGADP